ncbi:hypothetical protein D910_07271, partial [Dendroctonus ponderosae]
MHLSQQFEVFTGILERGALFRVFQIVYFKKKESNTDKFMVLLVLMEATYNGSLPQGDRGRKRSKFVLYKKPEPTGVRRSIHYTVNTPQSSQAILDTSQHSISYTLSRNHAVIVEYTSDDQTDMFQIGRSSETPIDFVVMDTVPGDKIPDTKLDQSTISRFACRILCERNNPTVARVYAAGFDSSKNIFLGVSVPLESHVERVAIVHLNQEKACKWQENDNEIDGQTTNGVLLMHPRGVFHGGEATMGPWVETSVGGMIFMRRESRSSQQRGEIIESESNQLQDGTLIDLCGATLLWRSAEGLEKSPSKQHLEKVVDELNAGRPQCPVGLNTLVIPRRLSPNDSSTTQQPYVYLNCGHVQGLHEWGQERESSNRKCPICLELGPVVKLCMGLEPAFYVDSGIPCFAFNPCGHMASEKTVKYWSGIVIPHGTNGAQAVCPFCVTHLCSYPGIMSTRTTAPEG